MSDVAVQMPTSLEQMPEGTIPATARPSVPDMVEAHAQALDIQERGRPQPGDDDLGKRFYRHPVTGEDMLEIKIPGDRGYNPHFPATDYYKQRFAAAWDAYVNDREQFEGQSLLADTGWVDPGMQSLLDVYGIKTVEQLAAVSDGNLSRIGPGVLALRDKARQEVTLKERAEQFSVKDAQVAELTDALAKRDAQIDAMMARMEALEAGQKTPPTAPAPTSDSESEAPEDIILKSDGTPFKTRQAAALSAGNRQLVAEPVEIEGGWGLKPRTAGE